MTDVLQCPGCGTKVRFTGSVPRTYTCRSCGAPWDLSAFQPEAAPERPVVPAAARSAPAPAHAAPRAHPGVSRAHHGRSQAQRSNLALWVTLAVVGAGAMGVFLAIGSKKEQLSPAEQLLASRRAAEKAERGFGPPPPGPVAGGPAAPVPPAPGPAPTAPTPPAAAPAPATGPAEAPAPAPGRTPPGKVKKPERIPGDIIPFSPVPEDQAIATYPYAADVTTQEAARIEESIRTALDFGGSDGLRAERVLVGMGVKAVPRLIGEFRALIDRYGLDKPEGLMRAMVLDRTLRKFDGVQERLFHDYYPIDVDRNLPRATRTVQNWNWWWATEEWKKNPRAPWDPKVDAKDPEEEQ